MCRGLIVVMLCGAYLASATGVAATAYSAWNYQRDFFAATVGWMQDCERAGIVNSGVNEAWIQVREWGVPDCPGTVVVMPSGWIGTSAVGIMNGSICGYLGPRYTTSAASGKVLKSALCPNPAGSQSFWTQMLGRLYDGTAYTNSPAALTSPIQHY